MRYLALEFYKLKHKYVFLTALALFLGETALIAVSLSHNVKRDGLNVTLWLKLLMQLSVFNSLFCPFTLAVLSSRVCDVEHKGDTWKLLSCCSERISSLYRAKFTCIMIDVAAAQAVQYLVLAGFGTAEKIPGPFPAGQLLASYLGTMMVNLSVLAVQEYFSMAIPNQFVSLVIGLFGSFIGFTGALYPDMLRHIFIWGYYIELAQTKTIVTAAGAYAIVPVGINWAMLFGVLIAGALLYLLGKHRLTRKEM